jgi:hypothetical protein
LSPNEGGREGRVRTRTTDRRKEDKKRGGRRVMMGRREGWMDGWREGELKFWLLLMYRKVPQKLF